MNSARKKRPAWRPTIDPGASTPLYIAIANQLAADVASGKLEPYARLPTHRDLAWTLGCTIGTITRAYFVLLDRAATSSERTTWTQALTGGTTDSAMISVLIASPEYADGA